VELLIVVAIIGILALIAITQLTIYREKAYCAEIKSDLATLAAHQESYFIDNHVYLAVTQAPDGTSNVPNFRWSTGVALVSSLGGVSSWSAVLGHPSCSAGPFTWNSATGGLH
jgi:Tfp pilus assembly protein PilE